MPRSYFELLSKDDHRVQVPAGKAVFEAGQTGVEMYIVTAGKVELRADGLLLETLEPGGVFGEMALVDDQPRSATAMALTDCELVPIDEKRFEFLLGRMPFFALEVMRVMARRLRRSLAD
jgi:CRP/FNR family cyclic AMP-dependent transcriptional regulator